MIAFTRREKHVAVVVAMTLILIFASGIDQQTLEEYSIPFMVLYVLPLGIYIVTDKERINKL